MTDHERYEELAALSVSGFLSEQETVELREHTKLCPDCMKVEAEFTELVSSGLPLTESPVRQYLQQLRTTTGDGVRERFLQRARREGVIFSLEVQKPSAGPAKRLGAVVAATAVMAAIV